MYKLGNGVEAHKAAPDTFEIPSDAQKASIVIGDHVKLMFLNEDKPTERMWVKVTGEGVGYLDNDPVITPLKWKDEIHFKPEHIIGVAAFDNLV